MNESFNIKRFLAFFEPVNKRQLIVGVFAILFLITFYSLYNDETNGFSYAFVVLLLKHQMQFDFMSSQSGLSRFLLLPATNLEKYLTLFIKAIVFPTIFIFAISLVIHFISMYSPAYTSASTFKVDQFYISILLFVILFCLRFVLHWKSFVLYLIIHLVLMFVLMIVLLFANKNIYDVYHTLANFQIYFGSFYILLSAALLLFTYPQMKKLEMNRIKEKSNVL